MTTIEILKKAKQCKVAVAAASSDQRNQALLKMAESLKLHCEEIITANAIDIENAKDKISPVMIDRLTLTEGRIFAMADAIVDVTRLPDPVGNVISTVDRPNGLEITKVSVPLGLLAMIYESRPNVTSDAAALSLKAGNVCVLRGGKEAINSNMAIAKALREGVKATGLPEDAISLVTDTSRQSATDLMTAIGLVDMLIPRGGAGLIRSCVENAKVPCIETGTGICHVYVDEFADQEKSLNIIENAKTSRPSVCNAAEVLLVHSAVADKILPQVKQRLVDERAKKGLIPVELRLDERALEIIDGTPASDTDFDTEFLDYVLGVKVVDSIDEAISHISAHSTGHSECIVTENSDNADRFTLLIDSAAVYVNASTRFTDGGEFGLGCEMGISTQKLHARGPMGLKELTSYKYIIRGNGQTR
ncbi:MAG: glutamate-5-semialdehyde dehydrogenase [Clostridia bacterium]|nr:glutamate-5-semialdehyde dehydrogenase [Clostridia bacterium]